MKKIASYILLATLLGLPLFLSAQKADGIVLSEKDQRKFDFYFFEAARYNQTGRPEKALSNYFECLKVDPNQVAVLFEVGRIFDLIKNTEQAFIYLEKAYKLAPDNKWVALGYAQFCAKTGNNSEAIAAFERLCADHPENVSYLFELAQLHFGSGNYTACIATLNKVEAIMGVTEELSEQKKEIYLATNNLAGAQKEMEKLVAAYPNNLEYKGLLAQFYAANDMEDKAMDLYFKMLEIAPDDSRAHLDLSKVYKNKGDFKQSYYHLKIAMASPDLETDSKIQVLYSFYELSETDTAMLSKGYELLKLSLAASPNEPKFYAMQSDFLVRDKKFEAARNSFKKATFLGANQLPIWSEILLLDAQLAWHDSLAVDAQAVIDRYPNQPLGYLMAGSANINLKNYDEGISQLEAGLDFVLENAQLEEQFYVLLADGYNRKKSFRESDSYFEKALEINPNNASTLNNYAYYLAQRSVNLERAAEMTERSNRLAPNNSVFLDTWAWVLYKQGKYTDALLKIEACARSGGATSGEVIEHWGDILYKLNRKTEALAKWREAATKPDASADIQEKISKETLHD